MDSSTLVLISEAHAGYDKALARRYQVLTARSGKQGIELARSHSAAVVILDALSMRSSGERIIRQIRQMLPGTPIIHLRSKAAPAVDSVEMALHEGTTPRKLANAVKRLLDAERALQTEMLRCGPFAMNLEERVLIAHGQELLLTPKQAALIEIFLRHPGETLPRKMLMQKVWETEYTGDTRTLDVHIRWLRRVIEPDQKTPRYIQTVRGVGYRLDLSADG